MAPDSVDATQRRRGDELYKAVDHTRARWSSFLISGNAGGVIATLSLIGATAARATPPSFPAEYLILLLVFLFGLFGSLFMIASDHIMAGVHWKAEAPPLILFPTEAGRSDTPRLMRMFRTAVRLARMGAIVSSLCMFAGAIGGVIVLARLARW